MDSLTLQLLKTIQWYQPKDLQHLIIPVRFSERLQVLGLTSDDKICGVSFEIGDVKLVTPVYNLEALGESINLPTMSLKLLQFKTAGVIGYSLQHIANKTGIKYKKDIYVMLTRKISCLYQLYSPSKVLTSLNWGFELLFAYLMAREGIEVDLYISLANKKVPSNWDEQSKLMAGELLTELDINYIEKPTRHIGKFAALINCDYLIYGATQSDDKFFMKKAREFNKPVIRSEIINNAK